MFEGILFFILIVLAIPFFIGYAVGKGSRGKNTHRAGDDITRIQGQAEVRDYLLHYLSKQPATIKKASLLKVMGVDASEIHKQSYYSEKVPESEEIVVQEMPVRTVTDENQSINVILYVASFLLVAAAVLFIGTNVPDVIKVVSAWGISIGFYAAGLALHAYTKRLKPAGVAFVGTGLALLPFAGLAMNLYAVHNAELSWFITSCIGLAAFLYATLALRSQALAYLTLGFVFSLSVSSAHVLQAPLVWSFIVIIVVASLLNFIAFLKPRRLSHLFLTPIDQSGQIAVPLAIFGSWVMGGQLELWQHGTVLAISALHYAVAALRPHNRRTYIFIARVLGMLSLLVFSYDYWSSWQAVGQVLTILATLQVVASAVVIKLKKLPGDTAWLWIGMSLQALAVLTWADSADRAILTTTSFSLVILTSLLVSLYLKRSRYASFGIGMFALLQIQLAKDLLVPHFENYVVALLFVAESALMLLVRFLWCRTGERLNVSASACVLYGVMAIIFALGEPSGWQAVVFFGLSLIAAAAAYVEQEANFYILANVLLFYAVYTATDVSQLASEMHWLITAWVSSAVFYIARIYFGSLRAKARADIMMLSGLITLLGMGTLLVFGEQTVLAGITMIIGSSLLAYEAHVRQQRSLIELAIIIGTFALQRIVADRADLDSLVYTHWWALTLTVIAFQRYVNKDKATALNWLITALIVFSVPTGFAALGEPEKYQLLFLFEHIGLLTLGGLANYRLITIWGAAGVALGVLYWLQDYTFLLVGLTGLGLIFFAVWRLLRKT